MVKILTKLAISTRGASAISHELLKLFLLPIMFVITLIWNLIYNINQFIEKHPQKGMTKVKS